MAGRSGGRALTWLDVFTSTPLAGNQLAVVHRADGLDEDTMLRFARETRLSESTFVQQADAEGADYRTRIFTTLREIRFAGHPSLGTAVAVARERGERSATYAQQTLAGVQPIDVEEGDGDVSRASMLQEPATFGPELDPGEVLAAAGLAADDADPELPVQVVGTGVPQVIAPVRREALDRVRADHGRLRALLDAHEAITLYLPVCEVDAGTARARSFMDEPQGAGEDPATGSAAGPLMAYLHRRAGLDRLRIEQGVEMGRPSRLECSVEGDRVRVGGEVVVVATGAVHL